MGLALVKEVPCLDPHVEEATISSESVGTFEAKQQISVKIDEADARSIEDIFIAASAAARAHSAAPSDPVAWKTALDMKTPVFCGTVLEQKFHNKSSYDKRFAWIKLDTMTLCLSEYQSIHRKHKAAKISDISHLVCGPPERLKLAAGEPLPATWAHYLSLGFQRGGGIDLRFETARECQLWRDVIQVLLLAQTKQREALSSIRQVLADHAAKYPISSDSGDCEPPSGIVDNGLLQSPLPDKAAQ